MKLKIDLSIEEPTLGNTIVYKAPIKGQSILLPKVRTIFDEIDLKLHDLEKLIKAKEVNSDSKFVSV